ncbi:LacI family transcriptional regulator [Litoreibacter ponti]|uniref:LacI family transcriptional regulator n=1 Tax=Litoreibacter ponti TaxID=1510457 RepID=A0A2T6BMT7_9RHOB|nr:LacI family DNA-binding transcriptional regulator [Litoreibacter ponti]PTX57393.1 LacI family transcriptional regulator [Litoreibacter ponti]
MSKHHLSKPKPTAHDVAREARVSLATVDRVLNKREGVRAKTVERVNGAIEKLGYVRDLTAANLARQRTYRFVFVLPDGQGQFLTGLRKSIAEAVENAAYERVAARTILISNRDNSKLVKELQALDPAEIDGLAIMSNETPIARDTIARMKKHGVAVVSLVADQPNSERDHFVGFDNVSAGRTAGTLLGRFAGERRGKVAVVVTSMQARDMIERRLGFDAVMRAEFPNLTPLPSIEAYDDPETAEELTLRCLRENSDVVAVYSAGASVRGVAAALTTFNAKQRILCIDHELTDNSRDLLEAGVLDAVINQNSGHLARSALRVMRAKCDNAPVLASQEHIRIEVLIRENLPPRPEPE